MFKELIEKGLVKEKKYPNGLSVFKYSREVFYKALWNTDPLLLEARGMVLDAEGNKVIWPFTKVFNYNENNCTCEPNRLVDIVGKINGFMAAVTWYRGSLLVSTTGTLDSEYAAMAREVITGQVDQEWLKTGYTYIFEICDERDPHIVEELPGAYLIGMRRMSDGAMATEYQLDEEAISLGAFRPETHQVFFHEALELLREVKHEGYMVRDAWTHETIMKLKSPHYLTKKFLMRAGQKKVDAMFDDKETFLKTIDEEFYPIVHHITRWFDAESWKQKTDAQRREIIEGYFESQT